MLVLDSLLKKSSKTLFCNEKTIVRIKGLLKDLFDGQIQKNLIYRFMCNTLFVLLRVVLISRVFYSIKKGTKRKHQETL